MFNAHAFISSAFRNGTKLDDLIDAVGIGTQMLPELPPMQVVQYQRIFVAMRGNQMLLVHRVLANMGVVQSIRVLLLPLSDPDIQKLRWDTQTGRLATQWERSLSSDNCG